MSASEYIPTTVESINRSLKVSNNNATNYSTPSASEYLIIKHLWLRRNASTIGGEAVVLVAFSDKIQIA